jgi:putative endonuclease
MSDYFLYIMASKSGTLYTGVTNDLARRVYQHKHRLVPGFTSRYSITRLVYFENTPDIRTAIAREKQIKRWRREKKVVLIESVNRDWKDLARDWFAAESAGPRANGPRRDSSTRSARSE